MAKQTGAGADGNRRYPGEVALGGKWSKSAGPETPDAERKPMVTPSLRASLTKQGYTIVGLGLGLEVGVGSPNRNPNPHPHPNPNPNPDQVQDRGLALGSQAVPVDEGDAARQGRLLQAHLLRHRLLPVHGGDALPRLRQQVPRCIAPSP